MPGGWGLLLCRHCAAQKQPCLPDQGTNKARQDEAESSLSFQEHGGIDLPEETLVVLDLLPVPGAGRGTVWRGQGCSHSSHMSLPLAPAALVPGCTARQCWARGSTAPQFPPPCSCHNSPRAGKANLPFWGEDPAVRINIIFTCGTGQSAEQGGHVTQRGPNKGPSSSLLKITMALRRTRFWGCPGSPLLRPSGIPPAHVSPRGGPRL